jgi:type I restriction enzyme S subunit
MPRTDASDLKAIEVSVPPLAGQRRIADLVRSIDRLADAYSRLAASATDLADSVRARTFSNSEPPVPLRELCDPGGIQIGPFGSQLHARDYVPDGVPVVMPQDMVNGTISEASIARVSRKDAARLARHLIKPGDILLPRRGDLTKRGFVTLREQGWLCGTGSVRIRVRRVDPRVVFHAISTSEANRWLEDHAVGVTMPNLNTAIVGSLPVRLAPNAESEVSVIDEARRVASAADQARAECRFARAALTAELLAGRREIPASYDRLLDGAA